MVVVAIVGVLSAVGLPQLTKAQDEAKDKTAIASLTNAAKECSLDFISGATITTTFTTFKSQNAITGSCAKDAILTITSASGAGTSKFSTKFSGAAPGTVVAGESGV